MSVKCKSLDAAQPHNTHTDARRPHTTSRSVVSTSAMFWASASKALSKIREWSVRKRARWEQMRRGGTVGHPPQHQIWTSLTRWWWPWLAMRWAPPARRFCGCGVCGVAHWGLENVRTLPRALACRWFVLMHDRVCWEWRAVAQP